LSELYLGLSNRKLELLKHQISDSCTEINIRAYFLFPEFSEDILNTHLDSIRVQEYENFSPVLVIDKTAFIKNRSILEAALSKSPLHIEIIEVDFFHYGIKGRIKSRRKLGAVIADILKLTSKTDAVVFIAPNEKIFSNHLQVLAISLMRNPQSNCAATAAILVHGNKPVHSVHEKVNFCQFHSDLPIGYARFIFRFSALPNDFNTALPYLDRKSMAVLVGDNAITQEISSSVVIDVTTEFPNGSWDEGQENNIIASFCPSAFNILEGYEIILPHLDIPSSKTPMVFNLFKRFNWKWVVAQITALRRHGISARLEVLKSKLSKVG
jgi:hypothetical protein